MLRAVFTSYQPYGFQYAEKLVNQQGWEALYFFTIATNAEDVRKKFPNAILHDYFDSIKCIPPLELKDIALDAIDPILLDKLSKYESIALNMMERNDPSNTFLYKDRLRLYHDLIRYWQTVLKRLDADIVIFEEEPHEASDLVLYLIAKELNIKRILFLRLPFFRMYPVEDYELGSTSIKKAYNYSKDTNSNKIELSENLNSYLEKIRGKYDIKKHLYNQTEGLKTLIQNENKTLIRLKKLLRLLKLFNVVKLPKRIKAIINQFKPALNQDQKSKYGNFRKTAISNWESNLNVNRTIRRKENLKNYYESLTVKNPDLNIPYIIYALNFQPERTTSPIGGHFVNQLLAIDLIAKSLPKDWKLYVKEHPSQFIHIAFGEPYRSIDYYKELSEINNVTLLPLITDIYTLIDNSKAVATITGTMAWESIVRGKPSLIFGYTWYQDCEGIFKITSKKDMDNAINSIQNGFEPNYNKIKLYTSILEKNSYRAFVGGNQEFIYSGISQEENAAAHYQAIIDYLS